MKKNLAVFISGQGSNLSVFLQNKESFAKLLVVSSDAEAYGLDKARRFGVEELVLDKPIDWQKLNQELISQKIEMIFLAGFMKILPASFVKEWEGRIFNLHPSLLPKYKGLKSIARAYEDKQPVGVTIHRVTPDVDSGEILFQKQVFDAQEMKDLNLKDVEFYTHVCEQSLVKDWIEKWA